MLRYLMLVIAIPISLCIGFVQGMYEGFRDLFKNRVSLVGIYILLALVTFKITLHYMSPYFSVAAETAPRPDQMRVQGPEAPPARFTITIPVGNEFNYETLPDGRVVPFTDHEERCRECKAPDWHQPDPDKTGELQSEKHGEDVQYCPECGDQTQRWQPGYGPYETPGRERFGRQWEGRQWEGRLGDGVWRSPVPEGFDGAPRAWGDRSQYYEYWDNENSRASRPHYGPPARFFPPPPKIRGYTPEYEYRYQGEYKNQNRMGY